MDRNERIELMRKLLDSGKAVKPHGSFSEKAIIGDADSYQEMYKRSIENPEKFWAEMADEQLDWAKKWNKVEEFDFEGENPYAKYFIGGQLNASYNCIDRHLTTEKRNKAALIWQGEPSEDERIFTYQRLHHEVCRAANMLKHLGVKKGDCVILYLPMIPELAIAMLACARIGAVHCVVFSGLSAEALLGRIEDSGAKVVITANYGYRSGKVLRLKDVCDRALEMTKQVEHCVVVRRIDQRTEMVIARDFWWDDSLQAESPHCEAEQMESNDPLFILYTSGSTAKPKGICHSTGGYLLYASLTLKYIFDLKETDIHWCTADAGWITGHSYVVYGPLVNGATTIMFEGVPSYPQPDRYWEIVEKFQVNTLYTAPTAIRAMMKEGESWVDGRDVSSLRILGSVGEPIADKAWAWFYFNVGHGRCPIVDTWWQTETGGIMITTLPGALPMKPSAAGRPFFGVVPKILDKEGKELGPNEKGNLVLERPWPGMLAGVHNNPSAFKQVYFPNAGHYTTGDGAYVDEDGYFWITGRIDDVINVSGHRMGTAEIESALISNPQVAEAAVVGYPHPIKGEGIYAYLILNEDVEQDEYLRESLIRQVSTVIGPIARPDVLHYTKDLPKTRSGKIMRRFLRKIAANELDNLGDTSTLTDPSVIPTLIEEALTYRH